MYLSEVWEKQIFCYLFCVSVIQVETAKQTKATVDVFYLDE